jgi:hypothetical protein
MFALVASLSAFPARAENLLRWKFAQGQKLSVTLEQKIDLDTTSGTKPRKIAIEMRMDMRWNVDAVDADGLAEISQTITRLKMHLEMAGTGPIDFDTDSTKPPQGAAEYFAAASKLIGLEIKTEINARGEIVSVAISDEDKQKIGAALAGTALAPLFSSAGLAETLKQTAAVLPEQAVNIDDTWQRESTAKLTVGQVRQQTTYTYRGPRDVDGQMLEAIELASQLEVVKPADAERPVTLKEHEHTGTLLFDAAAGRFVEAKVVQKLVTESPYRGTQVRVSANTTLTTTYRSE